MRSVTDYLILGAYGLLVVSLFAPWYRLRDQAPRPAELPFGWVPLLVVVLLAVLLVVEGRFGWVRWLRPLPLAAGCFMLGLVACLAPAPLAINALVARVLGEPADALAAELATLARMPLVGGQVAEWQAFLRSLPGRLAIDVEPGLGVFALGTLVLVVGGYNRLVARRAGVE